MIAAIIRWAIGNRLLVVMLALLMGAVGWRATTTLPLDAIPDLSDVQVIVKTTWPGQAPQVVEDQVTYPLTTALLGVPKASVVRGYSYFNDSFVYVIFAPGTDLYWARARVNEVLGQVAPTLPEGARPVLGPDATGIGWVYQYALVDRRGQHDLADLRSLQDWFLRFELQAVPGVAEVATLGGMVRQYQVALDPYRLQSLGIPLAQVRDAIRRGNAETGARVIEMAEAEYMVRVDGYVDSLADLAAIPVLVDDRGVAITVGDLGEVRFGPEMRRGIGELDGEGEVVGGVVVMRQGENALATIRGVKARLAELAPALPEGVEVVETYSRAGLIARTVATLKEKILLEFLAVVLVCGLFLWHLRGALVLLITLPLGVLMACTVMRFQGLSANIMSLGGIAIAIGAMVDASIVMIENYQKKLEAQPVAPGARRDWALVVESACEVGPALFFSLTIITLSFLPIFALEAQEGRLFAPLAFTKTYAMAAAAILSITLTPVLVGALVWGRVSPEARNPLNRMLAAVYRPLLTFSLRWPLLTALAVAVLLASALVPVSRLGSEFMPPIDEGDLLYMPSAFPAASAGKMSELIGQTNRLIKTVPEVAHVHAKAGRAETATDPAPLTMVESIITLRPKSMWRAGVTLDQIRAELDERVQVPSLTNVWTMPIRNRIDMLATGIKTPVGIKIAGPDLPGINRLATAIEGVVAALPETRSAYADRIIGGRYINVHIDRVRAARLGLNIADLHTLVQTAVGGAPVGAAVEGLERYPINLRFPESLRDSPEALAALPLTAPSGAHFLLGEVAEIAIEAGPALIRTENARLNSWVYVDVETRDLAGYVAQLRAALAEQIELPVGYSLTISGQYESLARARARLMQVVPLVVGIITALLLMHFRALAPVIMILGTLPLALVGAVWLVDLLDYRLSVAVMTGAIALAGVAIELGVLMLLYLTQSVQRARDLALARGHAFDRPTLEAAVIEGAVRRLRPLVMTALVIVIGLLPIFTGQGAGAEVMRRIAAPMLGGMLSALVLVLFVLPVAYFVWASGRLARR